MANLVANPYLKKLSADDPALAPIDLRPEKSEFGKGLSAFVDETQGIGGGLMALGAQNLKSITPDVLGDALDSVVASGLEIYDRNMQESTAGVQAPDIARIEDIGGAGELGDWAAYQLGKGLPNLAALGVGGAVGRVAGGAAVREGVKLAAKSEVGRTVGKKVVTKEIRQQARDELAKWQRRGTLAGGFAAGAGFEGGSAFGQMVGEGVAPEDAAGPATAVAGLGGALEFTPLYAVAKRMGMGSFAKEGIRKIIKDSPDLSKKAIALATAKEAARRAGGAGALGAGAEGITEGLQELAQIAGLRWAKDEELFADLSPEDWSQLANAAAAGALIGGTVAGGAGTFVGPQGEAVIPPAAPVEEAVAPVEEAAPTAPVDQAGPVPQLGFDFTPPEVILGEDGRPQVLEPAPRQTVSGFTAGRPTDVIEGEASTVIEGQDQSQPQAVLDARNREGLPVLEAPPPPLPPNIGRDGGIVGGGFVPPVNADGTPNTTVAPTPETVPDPTPVFNEYATTKAGTPFKSEATAERSAKQRGLETYEVIQRDGQWVIRDLGPADTTPAPGTTVSDIPPVSPDQITVLGQDTKGDVAEIRSPTNSEVQLKVDAERKQQGSFKTPIGTKTGKPFKTAGAANAAIRRQKLSNAKVVEVEDGFTVQTWPDDVEQSDAPVIVQDAVRAEKLLPSTLETEAVEIADADPLGLDETPEPKELLGQLKTAFNEGHITAAQHKALRARVARGDTDYAYGAMQEAVTEGKDETRVFAATETPDNELTNPERDFDAGIYDETDELWSADELVQPRTAAEIRAELVTGLGETIVSRLENSGLLKIHDRAHPRVTPTQAVNGSLDRKDGVINLWGGSWGKGNTAVGTLLHEGAHAGLNVLLNGKLNEFATDILSQAENGNEFARRAIEQAAFAELSAENAGTLLNNEAVLREMVGESWRLQEEVVAYYITQAVEQGVSNGLFRRLINMLKMAFAKSPFGRMARAVGAGFELTPELAVAYANEALRQTQVLNEELVRQNAPVVEAQHPGSIVLDIPEVLPEATVAANSGDDAEFVKWRNSGMTNSYWVTEESQVQMKDDIEKDKVTKASDLVDGLPPELAKVPVKFANLHGWSGRSGTDVWMDSGLTNGNVALVKPLLLTHMDRVAEDSRGWAGFDVPPRAALSHLAAARADALTMLEAGNVRAAETLREINRLFADPITSTVANAVMAAVANGRPDVGRALMDRMGVSISKPLLAATGTKIGDVAATEMPFDEAALLAEIFADDKFVLSELKRLGDRPGRDPDELLSSSSDYLDAFNRYRKLERDILVKATKEAGFTVSSIDDARDILGSDWSNNPTFNDINLFKERAREAEEEYLGEISALGGRREAPAIPLDMELDAFEGPSRSEFAKWREYATLKPLRNVKDMEDFAERMDEAGVPSRYWDGELDKVILVEGVPIKLQLTWQPNLETEKGQLELSFLTMQDYMTRQGDYTEQVGFQNPIAAMRKIAKAMFNFGTKRLADLGEGAYLTFAGSTDARQRIYERMAKRAGLVLDQTKYNPVFQQISRLKFDENQTELLSSSSVHNLFENSGAKLHDLFDPTTGVHTFHGGSYKGGDFNPAEPTELYSFADTVNAAKRWAWKDPSDPANLNQVGEFQKWYADYVDNLSTMEKKDSSIWDTFDLAKSKRGAKLDEIQRRFFHPLKKAVEAANVTMEEANDWLAARHIYLDNVNQVLAERASYQYVKDLAIHLPERERKEMEARANQIRSGKTAAGAPLTDVQARKEMTALLEEYLPLEEPSADVRIGGHVRAKTNYEWTHFKQHASGMFVPGEGLVNTMEAPNAKEIYERGLKNTKLQNVASLFDGLTRHQLDLLAEGGTITEAEQTAMMKDKQHYAPLRRELFAYEQSLDFLGQSGTGPAKGVTNRGGSVEPDRPVLIIQNALAQAHAAASSSQKNLANNALYDAIMANPTEWHDWFKVNEDKSVTGLDRMGFLQQQGQPGFAKTDLTVLRKGKRLVITPIEQNERAVMFAAAVNKLEAQPVTGAFKIFGWVNSIVRFTAISASPAFLTANLIRDPLTAVYNMQASEAEAHTKAIVGSYGSSFKALWKVYMKEDRSGEDVKESDAWWIKRFEEAGGRISFVQSMRDMDQSFGSFQTHVWAEKTPGVKQMMQAFKGIEDANIAVENIMRFATFRQLADKIGDDKAARISKDLTTNFDRRGFKSQTMGLLYLFFNATVQGNAQVVKNMAKSKKLVAMVGGTIAIAGLMDMMGRALSDEDDDGKKEWDKIPLYEKERNIVLPFKVGGEYIKIPAPWVYNVVWRMGGMLSEYAAGVRTAGDVAVDSVSMTLNTFNPMGGGTFAQALSPTALDPLMQVIENKDFAGNALRPVNFPGAGSKADAHLAWQSTPKEFKWIAQTLNELSGGDIANSGWLDVHPSTIQNTTNFLGGGLARFAANILGMPRNLAEQEIEIKRIPIVRQFATRPGAQIDTQLYHDRTARVFAADKAVREYGRGENRDLDRQKEMKEKYVNELRLVNYTKDVERQLKSLRARRNAAIGRKDERRAEVYKERIQAVQRDYNQTFERRVEN